MGRHEGAPWGASLDCVWGVPGWALSHTRPPFLVACGRGPLPTGCGCGNCRRGDPSPTPQRALLRAVFARCGGGTRAPGGGASWLRVGRPGRGALPRPTARPCGVRPGPATQWLWVRGMRASGPVNNPTARALASWLCALWGGGTRAPLGGGTSCLLVGRPGWGVLPSPTARPWGLRPGPATHWLWVRRAVLGTGCPWHLLPCRGSSCVVLAPRVCGTRWPLLLGTCPCALAVAGGVLPCVPRGPALVRRTSSGLVAVSAPVGFSVALMLSPAPGAVAPGLSGQLRGAGGGRPAAGPCRGRGAGLAPQEPVRGSRWGCFWRFLPASVLGCVHCGGWSCVDPVTDASGFPYRPSLDRGLGWCTGAVSCGRRHLPFRVGGCHARVPRVCACACSSWRGRAGRPPWRVLVCLTFPLAVSFFFFVRPPPGWGCPCFGCLFGSFFTWVPSPFFPHPPRATALSGFSCFPALGALGLGPLHLLFPPPPEPPQPLFFCFFCFLPLFVPSPFFPLPLSHFCCLWLFVLPGPGCPGPWSSLFAPDAPASPPPPSFFLPSCPAPRLPCLVFSVVSGPGCAGPRRFVFARPYRPLSLSLFFFLFFSLCSLFSLVPGALGARCLWHVRCVLGLSPTPRQLLVFRGVWCLVVWCYGLLWAVLCDLWCFAVFFGVLWCGCHAVLLVLALAVSRGRCFPLFLLVLCGVLLCRAVLCCVLSCVVPSRVVVWCVVLCVVPVRGVVWSSGPPRYVGFSCLPPLPCFCSLLPLPGPLSWLLVAFCPGVRCCVGLLCRLSCGVLLSTSFLAGAAPLLRSRWLVLWVVACGCSPFAAWSGCRGRALAQVLLPGRVAVLCPVFCGAVLPCDAVLWCPAVRVALIRGRCGWCGAVLLLGVACGVLC